MITYDSFTELAPNIQRPRNCSIILEQMKHIEEDFYILNNIIFVVMLNYVIQLYFVFIFTKCFHPIKWI